jgi:SAM-dependent methyltransferase
MLQQEPHAVLPEATQDELARQEYMFHLGKFCQREVNAGLRATYEKQALPEFVAAHGREPTGRHEVRKAMVGQLYYQLSSSMQRTTQEMLWNSVDETIQRQLPELIDNAARVSTDAPGSLTLDPDFQMPKYIAGNDHHAMPGGYSGDLVPGDVTAGALYDRGGFIYTQGLFGARMDGIGKAAVRFIRERFPDIEPTRILDMGCTAGGQTIALHDAWPDAKTHGIDVGAAVLRYAHARAASWGKPVHFSQQSAEHTNFADSSFDLVTCLATLHETSRSAVPNIFAEAYRLLKPGGLFVLSELPPYEGATPFEIFSRDWDTLNNNEPFWGAVHELDLCQLMREAGFPADTVFETFAAGVASANALDTDVPVENKKIVGSTRGGGQTWFAGARKF